MKVPINKVFQKLYTAQTRYFFLTGGRGSLKSSSVHDFIARLTYEVGHGILFTRWTMASAEKSIIPEFLITLTRLDIRKDFHVTRNTIRNLRTGSFIYFSGIKTNRGDETANLKGIAGITTWVIDEGEDFKDEKTFDSIDDSIRTATHQNRVIWIQNSTTREHFQYKRWIEPANRKEMHHGYSVTVSAMPEVTHIHTTYHIAENMGYLSKGWLDKVNKYRDEAEKSKNREKTWYYYNYIGGWLEKEEGVVFENWEEGEFDMTLPSVIGLDPGYYPDPLAATRVAVDKKRKRIYLKEIIYETELSTEKVTARLSERKVSKTTLIVSDTNEPRLINSIREAGYNIVKAVKRAIIDDIREMQGYSIIIDPDSPNLKKEFNKYVWNDKKASIPIDAWNHSIDGSRYGFRRLVPLAPTYSMTGHSYNN
jgi:phage terminase large subunit